MKIRLEDIPPEGKELDFSEPGLGPQELGHQVARVVEPPRAHLQLMRQEDVVVARGQFEANLVLTCSRCLGEAPTLVQGRLETTFLPQGETEGREMRLDQDEMELNFYQGDELDLGQILRDEISLALPMAPLCSPTCPGICPDCGKSLTQGDCGCGERNRDPRWAKLAELKKS